MAVGDGTLENLTSGVNNVAIGTGALGGGTGGQFQCGHWLLCPIL